MASAIWPWDRPRRRRPLAEPPRRPALEALEDRVLLAVLPSAAVAVRQPDLATGPATIRGFVFNDHDGNGQRSGSDAGLAGRVVFLDANGNGKLDPGERHTTTAADGSFTFTGLAAGTYTVVEVVPPGWAPTSSVVTASIVTASSPADKLIELDRFRADPRFAGIDGSGETVVVLDSGVDSHNAAFGPDRNHDGSADAIVYQHDFLTGNNTATDVDGHGTYVASLIASRLSDNPGVAPGVNLISLKVLDDQGNGQFNNIDKALQWVLAHAQQYHIVCVNMSFGDGGNYTAPNSLYGIGPDLEALALRGITVVAAAGNNYQGKPALAGLAYPAIDPNVIPVGAVWDADHGGPWVWDNNTRDNSSGPDRIVSFSQRLPGSGELFAPGTLITGAAPGGGTASLSGTSTATALVSGLVALAQQLAQQKLGHLLSVAQVRALLSSTGVAIVDGAHEDDNVSHTGATFRRVDAFTLGEAIIGMGSVSAGPYAAARLVSLPAGITVSNVALGAFRYGSISGRVFHDANGNGRQDLGDDGLAGRVVFADLNGNGRLDPGEPSTRTDALGRFTLTGLGPGAVTIRVVLRAGEGQTTAARLTVSSGMVQANEVLGVKEPPPNHAPTLTGDGATTTLAANVRDPACLTVAALLGSTFQDADHGALRGIAVTGASGTGGGTWQYSLNGGQSWLSLGTPSLQSALLLDDSARVRFVPAASFGGTVAITYRAWDRTSGSSGGRVNLSGAVATGGRTAFSSQQASARVVVTPVDSAPVLTGPGHLSPAMLASANPPGDLVRDILAGTVGSPASGASVGLAVIGATGFGKWQYSRDGGRTWSELKMLSPSRARLLAPTDRIRFLPGPGWNGQATLTYRAWDQSTGTDGSVVDLSGPASVGGRTAFSAATATAAVPGAAITTSGVRGMS
jgi:subtilisin family serine protease